ncbi:hypothetical protein E4T39_07769 [Aureobasidium subglaciale]|nr:hypothetical protein E4T39_07769 [Aureobasidium subglaciale]
MFSFRSNFFSNLLSGGHGSALKLDLPPVESIDIEETPEKRARTLKHLIKANHINHSIIYHDLEFHNHSPHILGTAYFLGANVDQLLDIYEKESKELEPWEDSPSEIARHDWRDYLGKREYGHYNGRLRAWVDFLEDQLVQFGYDWRELLDDFLYSGKQPLINNLIAGLAHPLIHLGFALELASPTVAIESLALVAAFYNHQHVYLDDPSYTKPSPWSSQNPFDVIQKVHSDSRLESFFNKPGEDNYSALTEDKEKEAVLLEYWNSWTITDPKSQFEAAQRAAVALLVGTHEQGQKFDFFLVHILTSSHAVRVIAPLIRPTYHVPLLRQWWLFLLTAYIGQLRPAVSRSKISDVDLAGRDWKWVADRAVNGEWAQDAHFVKGKPLQINQSYVCSANHGLTLACRSIQEAAKTWGDEDQYFLKAAVKLSDEFNGWGGFSASSEDEAEATASNIGFAARHRG